MYLVRLVDYLVLGVHMKLLKIHFIVYTTKSTAFRNQ